MGTFEGIKLQAREPQIRYGFPLFPQDTTIDDPALPRAIGRGTEEPQVVRTTIIDTQLPLAAWRLTGGVISELFGATIAGFSIEYQVAGVTRRNGTGDLRVRLDQTQGGLAVGANLNLDTRIRLERGSGPRVWNSMHGLIYSSWETHLEREFSPTIDIINLAIIAFNISVGGVLPLQELRGFQTLGSRGAAMWGLFDERNNRFAADNQIQLRPRLDVHVNVLRLIPKVSTAIKVMAAVGLRVSQGPSFVFTFPINIRVVRLSTVDGNYDVLSFGGPIPGTVRLVNGPVGPTTPNINEVEVVHEHTVGIEFRFEVHATISFLNLVNLGGSAPLPFLVFPQQPRQARPLSSFFGPYYTKLSSEGTTAQMELPDVVWG